MGDVYPVDHTIDFTLDGGFVARLQGWTHARKYAQGLLRNSPGDATAIVSGLSPNQPYEYVIYQFAGAVSWDSGANGFQVNGVTQPDTIQKRENTASNTPTAHGVARARADGTILFTFTKKANHVNLSGMSISPAPASPPPPPNMPNGLPQSTSFLMGDDVNYPVDHTIDFNPDHGGFVARLHGWTHARKYAQGLLRNSPGDATAIVSGLSPNQPYEYVIYQFAGAVSWDSGANGFQVNGVTQPDTIQKRENTASNTPTAHGVARARADGTILFTFTKKANHVNLSGMSISPG